MLVFAHGWVWWLAPLPIVAWWLLPPRSRDRPALRVPFMERLRASGGVIATRSTRGFGAGCFLRVMLWLAVLAALARPQWLEPPVEKQVPTRDLLLLVDLSASMEQADFTDAEGKVVDRLSAARDVLGDFLLRREGDRVGLVVFGSAPFVQAPFTSDLALCHALLEETKVGMAGPRTSLGDAIGLGIQLFDGSDAPAKTIIALTDGNDTASAVPPVEAARIARDRGITIHTVAMGDPTTVGEDRLDTETLDAVAKSTGGQSFLALDRRELSGIYAQLDEIETREIRMVSHRPRRDVYYWPLGVALVASLAFSLLGSLRAAGPAGSTPKARLRVNPRTFELETTEG
jgi:Ca-activated chloride channel family protein